MHEMGLAMEIAAIASRRAEGARVTRVVVEVGKLAMVVPDALQRCFEVASGDTPAFGAALDIVEVPGRARCRACDLVLELERPVARCGCGTFDLEWLSGEELRVTQMEVI